MIIIYLITNSASPILKGRLKAKLDYWHTIGANNFVTDTIKFVYRIPLISTACRALIHNNKLALENASFVESAISELVGPHMHVVFFGFFFFFFRRLLTLFTIRYLHYKDTVTHTLNHYLC